MSKIRRLDWLIGVAHKLVLPRPLIEKSPRPLSQSRVGRILRLSSYSTSHEW